jgi:hypothetical protein
MAFLKPQFNFMAAGNILTRIPHYVTFQILTAASMKFIESSGMYSRVVTLKLNDVSEVRTASIIRAMNKPRAKGWQSLTTFH